MYSQQLQTTLEQIKVVLQWDFIVRWFLDWFQFLTALGSLSHPLMMSNLTYPIDDVDDDEDC